MNEPDIIVFARANLEQIPDPSGGGAMYRYGAVLHDGLYLPCVALATLEPSLELARRRFEETRADGLLPEDKRKFGYGLHTLTSSRASLQEETG